MHRRLPLVLLTVSAVFVLAGTAAAQRRGGKPAMPSQPMNMTGEVDAVAPGMLRMTAGGQPVVLAVAPDARITAKGKAKTDFLAPGHCISFVASVDRRSGKLLEEKVSKLTLCTPDARKPVGAFPEGFAGAFGDKQEKGKKEDAPFASPFGQEGTPPAKGKGGAAATQSFEIRGPITGVKNGKYTLQVPNVYFKPQVKIEIPEDADIDIDVSGMAALLWSQRGDKIQVHGQQYANGTARVSQADIALVDTRTAATARKKVPPRADAGRGKKALEPEGGEEPPRGKAPGTKKAESEDAPKEK